MTSTRNVVIDFSVPKHLKETKSELITEKKTEFVLHDFDGVVDDSILYSGMELAVKRIKQRIEKLKTEGKLTEADFPTNWNSFIDPNTYIDAMKNK